MSKLEKSYVYESIVWLILTMTIGSVFIILTQTNEWLISTISMSEPRFVAFVYLITGTIVYYVIHFAFDYEREKYYYPSSNIEVISPKLYIDDTKQNISAIYLYDTDWAILYDNGINDIVALIHKPHIESISNNDGSTVIDIKNIGTLTIHYPINSVNLK